jgi:predicted N-formylglutamate amidohydrolase
MYYVFATKETTYRTEAPVAVFHTEDRPAAKRLVAKLRDEKVYKVRKYRRFDIKPVVFEKV